METPRTMLVTGQTNYNQLFLIHSWGYEYWLSNSWLTNYIHYLSDMDILSFPPYNPIITSIFNSYGRGTPHIMDLKPPRCPAGLHPSWLFKATGRRRGGGFLAMGTQHFMGFHGKKCLVLLGKIPSRNGNTYAKTPRIDDSSIWNRWKHHRQFKNEGISYDLSKGSNQDLMINGVVQGKIWSRNFGSASNFVVFHFS